MCGIAGFFGSGDRDTLVRMADRIRHRGPDGEGFFVSPDRGIHLAHRRLSILDHADGAQPMWSEDRSLVVIFNGEIYNFRELRAELARCGARFRSDHSDTEVLLHAWREWGENLTSRLNGMWAFALIDFGQRRAFLSRDRFGKKPLYWFSHTNGFAFASELTALREHPAAPATLSERALRKYFGYGYVPAPLTFLEGVNKLPAGHSLTLDLETRDVRIDRYWQYQPEPVEQRPAGIEDQWIEEFRSLLDAAVARRLVADVPVGCFLSGGLDSSTVAALAVHHAGQNNLKTFSIGFEEADFDETRFASEVATHIGVDHQIERLPIARALDILPDLAARLDEPIADSSLLPTYLVCAHARTQVTVVLGGDGADELLAGYDPFRALRYARWYRRMVPQPVHHGIAMLAARLPVSHGYMSLDFRVKRMLRGLDHPANLQLPVWMAPLAPSELEQLFASPIDIEDLYSEAIETWDGCAVSDPVERAIAFYIRLYLQDDILTKVDRASMLHSLEVRAPFLDMELVEFLRRLPADMKLRGGTSKWILRQAAKSLLPESILTRSKQGFAVPIGRWFRDGRIPQPRGRAMATHGFHDARLADHRAGRSDQRLYLWADWILNASHLSSAATAT